MTGLRAPAAPRWIAGCTTPGTSWTRPPVESLMSTVVAERRAGWAPKAEPTDADRAAELHLLGARGIAPYSPGSACQHEPGQGPRSWTRRPPA
jgi:hypothetical protein